jgi:hypothetical protein
MSRTSSSIGRSGSRSGGRVESGDEKVVGEFESEKKDASELPPPVKKVGESGSVSATTSAKAKHIQNIRNIIEANNGWAKVKRVEDINPYISKLQQFANDTPIHIDAPKNVKGKQVCPSTNGVTWSAHRKPEPDLDKKLGQQWSITRKDYQGKNTQLFCYPPSFNGEAFKATENNPEENLDLFAYTSPNDVTESLHTLVDIILPNNSITDVDRSRAQITNAIIEAQNSSKLKKALKNGIEQLAGILATCEYYAGKSRQAREIATKKQAKHWLTIVHNIAIANIGLNDKSEAEAKVQCVNPPVGGVLKNKDGVFGCFPDNTLNEITRSEELLHKVEQDKVKNFLIKYAKTVVQIQESIKNENWETAFYNLTKDQRSKKWVRVDSSSIKSE